MCRVSCCVIMTAAAFTSCDRALAVNEFFLPGDAFFHSRVSAGSLDQLDAADSLELRYVRPIRATTAFCGYAGFSRLTINGDITALKRHLAAVHGEIKDIEPRGRVVTGLWEFEDGGPPALMYTSLAGFHLFVYNRDFPRGESIGLKFNDAWDEMLPALPGNQMAQTKRNNERFVGTKRAIKRDQRRAELVPGLRVTVPDVGGLWGDQIDEPVTIDASEIKIVLVPQEDLKPYAMRRAGYEYYEITLDGVQLVTFTDTDVAVEDWPFREADAAKQE